MTRKSREDRYKDQSFTARIPARRIPPEGKHKPTARLIGCKLDSCRITFIRICERKLHDQPRARNGSNLYTKIRVFFF
ncbi:hypothetical protein SORBI_3007G072200 [Sorghum bicolor]|uniref:Uncharacterized protein n=1 Tax=Sorghum bicolor TaxID=4558 RepID=A0A1B6PG58_SORBI|nr:hypothetical protein SORBI_3007G072200 [Sorghum bicolor]